MSKATYFALLFVYSIALFALQMSCSVQTSAITTQVRLDRLERKLSQHKDAPNG